MASVFEEAVRVLSKPPSERTGQECRALVPWLRQLSPLLEPHAIDVLIDFIQNCRYQRVATDHVLIWRGKFEQSYCLIMKGSVSLHLDGVQTREDLSSASAHPSKELDVADTSAFETLRSVSGTGRPPAESTTGDVVTGFGDGTKKVGHRPKLGKFIISYGAGESLFDCSLIIDVKPVGVTAICDKPTYLLLLENDFVSNEFREILREEILHMRIVVQSHPLFAMVPQRLQSLLLTCLRRERFTFDSVVIQQGHPVAKIFIIRSGQAKILIESGRHQFQYPHLWPFETETDIYVGQFQWLRESRKSSLIRKYINPAMTSFKNHQVAVRRKDGYAGVEKWLKNRVVNLCTVLGGEVLGDIELSLGLPTYLQTVKTLHHMTVYVLTVSGFERILGRSTEQEAYRNEVLMSHIYRKLENRMNAKYGQVPLLKCLHGVLKEALKKKHVKSGKNSKMNDGEKNPCPDLLPAKRRSDATKEQSPDIGLGASFLPSLAFLEAESGQRRARRSSIFERLHKGQQADNSDSNREGRCHRRMKKRRWAGRSLLQVREAIKQKIAEDQFKDSPCGGKNERAKAKRQLLSGKIIQNYQAHPGFVKVSLALQRFSVSDLIKISEDQMNDTSEPDKLNRNQLPQITIKNFKGKDSRILPDEGRKTEDNSILKINDPVNSIISKTRLKPHCNQQDLTSKLASVPEETEPIQFQTPTFAGGTNSTELVNNSSQAQIIEKGVIISEGPENMKTFNFGMGKTTKIALDRDDLTPWGVRRENKDGVKRIYKALGFDNEQRVKIKLPAIGAKGGNYESTNYFLSNLEERLRQFHQENLDSQYKYTLKLPSLKRYEEIEFEVDGETYGGPRPGGKVLIRKRKCRYQGFFAHVKDHQHIHYHMVDSIPNLPIIDPYRRTKNM